MLLLWLVFAFGDMVVNSDYFWARLHLHWILTYILLLNLKGDRDIIDDTGILLIIEIKLMQSRNILAKSHLYWSAVIQTLVLIAYSPTLHAWLLSAHPPFSNTWMSTTHPLNIHGFWFPSHPPFVKGPHLFPIQYDL